MSGIEAAFLGTLSRDAEAKTSGSGKPYLRITGLRIGDGDKAQWVNVTAFDQEAIASTGKFLKGAAVAVYVEGRIALDRWKGTDGGDRSGLSCMSWHCRLAQIGRHKSKRTRHTGGPSVAAGSVNFGGGTSQAGPADFDDEVPF
jgi:single-stranded DNA-binding protein